MARALTTNTQSSTSDSLWSKLVGGVEGATLGAIKGGLTAVKGVGTLGQSFADQTAGRVVNAVQGNGFIPTGADNSAIDIYHQGTSAEQKVSETLKPQGTAETIGNVAANVGIGAASLAATGNPSTLLGSAAQMGLTSAAQTGLTALGEGKDYKTAAKDAFVSGLTGAAVGAAGKALSNTVGALVEKGPTAMYNNALKVLNKVKTAGKSPAEFLKNEGVWGGLGSIQKAATEGIGAENAIIKQAAFNTPGGLTYDEVIQKAAKDLSKNMGDLYTPDEVLQLIKDVPLARIKNAKEVVPWVDIDGVRSSLGNLIGDQKWLSTMPSEKTKAAEAVYHALSNSVKDATKTTENFSRLSQWIGTNKAVSRTLQIADSKYGIGLLDTVSGAGGAVAGGLQEGDVTTRLKNAALGGLGAVALERGVNSPAVKTGLAQILEHIGSLPTDSAGKISKSVVEQLLNQFTSSNQEAQQVSQQSLQLQRPVSSTQSSTQLTPEQRAAVDKAIQTGMKIDPSGIVGSVGKVGMTTADIMKDSLLAAFAKESPNLKTLMNVPPKLSNDIAAFVDFLKKTSNPAQADLNHGLELLQLSGRDAGKVAQTVIDHVQKLTKKVESSVKPTRGRK